MDKHISVLRTIFRASNVAFNFSNSIQSACGGIVVISEMQKLHKIALEEIEKENPDLSKMHELLEEMENLAHRS